MLGYAITSMETETYRPARLILLGEDASPQRRRSTSLDALVTPRVTAVLGLAHGRGPLRSARAHLPFRLSPRGQPCPARRARVPARPHSLGLARGAGGAEIWTTLADAWIHEQAARPERFSETKTRGERWRVRRHWRR